MNQTENIAATTSPDLDQRTMIAVAGLPFKASYRSAEVCPLPSLRYSTFQRMYRDYEPIGGRSRPGTLKSGKIPGQRRVS